MRQYNAPDTTFIIRDQSFYNNEQASLVDVPADISIHCQGVDPRPTASRLFASLFYVELMTIPSFHKGTERVRLLLQCRIPQGLVLVEVVNRLYRRRAQLYYGEEESELVCELMVTPTVLARCSRGERFERVLEIPIHSMTSFIHIQIDELAGPEYISNCPYQIRKLVQDQGLDCAFGRKDNRNGVDVGDSSLSMLEAIDRLSRSLQGVIGLWGMTLTALP